MSILLDDIATAIWVYAPTSSKNDEFRDRLSYIAARVLDQIEVSQKKQMTESAQNAPCE
jgi:hypothetical protein